MKRRAFLTGAGTLALSQLVAGCQGSKTEILNIRLLRNSIPPQLLNEFRNTIKPSPKLNFAPIPQLKEILKSLETWKKPAEIQNNKLKIPFLSPKQPEIPDLVTLGDYWLESAIQQQLIQPIALDKLKNWQQMPKQWQELVQRNEQGQLDAAGKIWGAPYRWGSTVIAYRKDKFKSLGWTPTNWSDLWREECKGRISLLDQPREIIGLTLKHLGYSYNTTNLDEIKNLKDALKKLHQNVKLYSSDTYLQPLILGDTWLAVGWSTDVLKAIKSEPKIAAVVPQSGTALWADVWVRPKLASANSTSDTPNLQTLADQWIDFCWQPKSASAISIFTEAVSPVLINMDGNDIPKDLVKNQLLLPNKQIIQKSEFLHPLSKATEQQYLSLWQEIRNI
ncbi:extracellular solute-binding protein family 1 [Crinalium epipsammum PCC 9333]|uniref:Extracellular solute-binding protein family 1 n=1 Tax=Crinalium epipsammum PCC 9333 TaxID=1173022 RepID=K9VUP1_9CYAN|nr:extracellular solute-binding protein [Crinalium epipsammum]AFZ11828.1 extracellular solute-binding protein family 1 [Crinalium epipsammum PCC 9333]